ncbi:MAG: KH domain-containing protein, partial [Deltaproteobacteria bacterium]|nr:KH domain-containing protein [Deltaproteobacteria bacterium]
PGRERAPSRQAEETPSRQPRTSPEERPPANVKPVELAPLPSAGTGEYPDDPAHLERAKEILARIIAPLTDEARIETSWQDEKIYLEVSGDDSGLLIGRKGQTLDAVQFVVSKILDKWAGQHLRIMVDTEGYQARRIEALRQTAKELADQVIVSGKSAATGPLNPYDRRIIHLSLQDDDRLKTRSHGEGTYKRVVILLRSQGGNRAEG